MTNQQSSAILAQIERIEKRMTALHERGLDISALTSQILIAREMLSDGRYEDALVYCQELLDVADQIAVSRVSPTKSLNQVPLSVSGNDPINDESCMSEETKRFQAGSRDIVEQIQSVIDIGLVDALRSKQSARLINNDPAGHMMRQQIAQRVGEDTLQEVLQEVPTVNTKRIERALERMLAHDESSTSPESEALQRAMTSLISRTIDCSLSLFEEQLHTMIDQLLQSRKLQQQEDIDVEHNMSVKLILPEKDPLSELDASSLHRSTKDRDDDSFMGLPQIPRHGESFDDDSVFQSVVINSGFSESVYQEETETNKRSPPTKDGYEPVTGSSLRPNTSVFTEMNAVNNAPVAEPLAAEERDSQSNAFKVLADMMGVNPQASNQQPAHVQVKNAFRTLLPELLKDDAVKQALFASLAIEAVTKPSVLGSLTGLKNYIRQELQ